MGIEYLASALLKILLGFFLGVTIGLTGAGGALILPVLIHILRVSPVTAVGTGLAVGAITKVQGFIIHAKQKSIRPRRAKYFLAGGLPGVLFASELVNRLVAKVGPQAVDVHLRIIIGIVLITSALVMFFQVQNSNDTKRLSKIEESRGLPVPFYKRIATVVLGFIVGLLFGTTSIGAGVLIVPIFLLFLDANCSQAIGTSIFISLLLGGVGSIAYFVGGHVEMLTTVLLCAGSLFGVGIGSRLSKKIPEAALIVCVALLALTGGIGLLL